jgi:hypothetical protein
MSVLTLKKVKQPRGLNFDREPRYYADLGFDRGVWYMANSPTKTMKIPGG